MIQVYKQQHGDTLSIKLSGSIEENVDFSVLIGLPQGSRLEVLLKEVTRINSLGVKSWMKYFQLVHSKGVQIQYFECSTAIVEQLNSVMSFSCGGTVESLYVPYVCPSCATELLGLYKTSDVKKLQYRVPDLSCPKCQSQAKFDDITKDYFGFLQRR